MICPFKGLAAFDVADAQYFFGRERLVRELVDQARRHDAAGRRRAVRKREVLRRPRGSAAGAGRGRAAGAQATTSTSSCARASILRTTSRALVGDGPFVLAVDQFEEVFTVCRDPDERAAFIAAVMRLVDTSEGRGKVIFALRADQYGRCAEYPALSRLLGGNHVLVPPLSRDEVRARDRVPVPSAPGLEIDPELTERLIDDVERQAGALPLLSTALLELWQRRDGRHLRLAAYADTGGISGAVARLAEDAFGQFEPGPADPRPQPPAPPHRRGRRGRRRAPSGRARGTGDRGPPRRRPTSFERLTDQRLLTVTAGTVELSHEALLREWPRLRAWIDEDLDGLRIQRALTIAADEWERVNRDDELLYRGTRLTEALEWRTRRDEPLNHHERDFLDASEARRRGNAPPGAANAASPSAL